MATVQVYRFDNIEVGGVWRPGYIGEATHGVNDDDPRWTIYKLTYEAKPDGEIVVTQIEERADISWTNRADPWA